MLPLLPCFKVLPLVYDESLSYYEVLCKLVKSLQEFAQNSDNNFDSIKKEIEDIIQKIEDLKAYVDKQDESLDNKINEEIKKCHEHCEVYAKSLYNQLLDILNQYQGNMKQWVLGEIAKIPSGIPKQFAITGNPETSGLQHDIVTVTRESMCDFVASYKYPCEIFDSFGVPISCIDDNNTAYNLDTLPYYNLLIIPNDFTYKNVPFSFILPLIDVNNNVEITIICENEYLKINRNETNLLITLFNNNNETLESLELPLLTQYLNIQIDNYNTYLYLFDYINDYLYKESIFSFDLNFNLSKYKNITIKSKSRMGIVSDIKLV